MRDIVAVDEDARFIKQLKCPAAVKRWMTLKAAVSDLEFREYLDYEEYLDHSRRGP
jgi:hypothetical protein